MAAAKDFFTEDQKAKIVAAIGSAEKQTSGEIRVHIENDCPGDAVKCAEARFGQLKMHETALQNGVLFYLAVKAHKFAIYGGKGVNDKVPADFWNAISAHMGEHFRAGRFTEGLAEGIAMAGEALREHFPLGENDKNELSDDINFQ
jgi:uncharacterized membrane protein